MEHDFSNMAREMYQMRVNNDTKKGRSQVYENNPDAQALYFKGVHDTIDVIETWMNSNTPIGSFALLLEFLYKQTSENQN